mmetsp:Transcript_4724/g.11433  ORF Transcript_4724/g.11433 Transcript_4724/m.11433 type:complete len:213 (+) Transcript_4724:3908-4546(+)
MKLHSSHASLVVGPALSGSTSNQRPGVRPPTPLPAQQVVPRALEQEHPRPTGATSTAGRGGVHSIGVGLVREGAAEGPAMTWHSGRSTPSVGLIIRATPVIRIPPPALILTLVGTTPADTAGVGSIQPRGVRSVGQRAQSLAEVGRGPAGGDVSVLVAPSTPSVVAAASAFRIGPPHNIHALRLGGTRVASPTGATRSESVDASHGCLSDGG